MSPATNRDDVGIYVHFPFCDRVCPYCDFAVEAVGSLPGSLEEEYGDHLVRELDLWLKATPGLRDRPLSTVYLGGGTPSLFSVGGIGALLAAIRARFPGEPEEVTLELNPGTTECGRVAGFREAGVTRLSVGVQSFHDPVLKRLGRAHVGAEALRGLDACLGGAFRSVSADLIYGVPGQTEEQLMQDVARLLEREIPHVSAYALTIEPGTPFGDAHDSGRLELPEEDTTVRMSRRLCAELSASGRTRYEISSFALPGHRSLHNQRYWRRRDVLGIGLSAVSLLGDRRMRNVRDRARWSAEVAAGRLPREEIEERGGVEARRETLFLGLRMIEGVSRADYLRRYGVRPEDDFGSEIDELTTLGLLENAAGFLRPTERGILFSDDVLLRFSGR